MGEQDSAENKPKVLSLGKAKDLKQTIQFRCEECILSFDSFEGFWQHWVAKHFEKGKGFLYTYKTTIATLRIGSL